MVTKFKKVKTPIGHLNVVEANKKIIAVIFDQNWRQFKANFPDLIEADSALLRKAAQEFQEYFTGTRRRFSLPYNLEGTSFQKKVWIALKKIKYGQTISYKEQAKLARSPRAVRAVGRINGLNPLCIILPCHRVIGTNGKLTGYAAGLKAKRFLLELEGAGV